MAKIKKNFPFTTVPNALLEDHTISPQSRFLYSYLFSRPDDWTFHNSQLMNVLNCSRGSLLKYKNELIESGWITMSQSMKNDGTFGSNIYELNTQKDVTTQKQSNAQLEFGRENTSTNAVAQKTGDGEPLHKKTAAQKNRDGEFVPLNKTDLINKNNPINKKDSRSRKTLFRNSDSNDFELIQQTFDSKEFEKVNLKHYFDAVSDWSDLKDQKRTAVGWIATIRSWIRKDIANGRLVKQTMNPESKKSVNKMVDDVNQFLNERGYV